MRRWLNSFNRTPNRFRIDFSEDRQHWADRSERELLLDMSRTGEANYDFDRQISITYEDRDLSEGGWTPVFGLAFELGYALDCVIKNHADTEYIDADGWPMEISPVGSGAIALTTFSWVPRKHGSKVENEDGTYLIGTATVSIDEFGSAVIDLLDRFHTHLRGLYAEAHDNPQLDQYVSSLKGYFQ